MSEPEVEREDHELVRRARKGDKEAFRGLVEKYQGRLYALSFGMLQEREEALDVVQEAFLKSWRSLGSFKGKSSFYTWVYRIATNLALDHLRKRARTPRMESVDEVPVDQDEEELPPKPFFSPKDDPTRPIDNATLGEAIRHAIRQLPVEQQIVVVLRDIEGHSYNEIARVTRCRPGTVMSRLFYARRKLQEKLKPFLE